MLGFRLPNIIEQHYFYCNTCSLSVCQICSPFLHKHHDLNYTGKEGTCIHDSSSPYKKLSMPSGANGGSNIFSSGLGAELMENSLGGGNGMFGMGMPGMPGMARRAAPSSGGMGTMLSVGMAGGGRSRREEDMFTLNFDLGPEEDMEYNEQMRFRELMEIRLH